MKTAPHHPLVPLILTAVIAFGFTGRAQSFDAKASVTRLACVGDSITYGVGVKDRQKESFPSQLARLLGARWQVRNFGVSGATMMQKGDLPYDQRPEYREALEDKPDVVVIALGTNDSKPQNIDAHPDDFTPSYRNMIATFREANPNIKIYACLPPPAFPEHWGIRERVITGKIIPLIQKIAKEEKVSVIDLHAPLVGKAACFPDQVHPNERGAAFLAKAIDEALVPAAAK